MFITKIVFVTQNRVPGTQTVFRNKSMVKKVLGASLSTKLNSVFW